MSAPIQRLSATVVRRLLSKPPPPPLPQVRAMSAKSGGGNKLETNFVKRASCTQGGRGGSWRGGGRRVRWQAPKTEDATKPSQAQVKPSIEQQSSIKEVTAKTSIEQQSSIKEGLTGASNQARKHAARKAKLQPCNHVCTVSEKPRQQPQISFSDQDLQGVHLPHDDALVINMRIDNFEVRRVLIDNGGGGNVIKSSTLDNMKIDKSKLSPSNILMSGFGGGTCVAIGAVELSVTIGTGPKLLTALTKFFVVETPLPYDAILGRPWLHDQGVIPSSLHQCLKFALGNEVITIRGDQSASRECNTAAMSTQVPVKPSIEQQPSLEAETGHRVGDYLLLWGYFALVFGGPLAIYCWTT